MQEQKTMYGFVAIIFLVLIILEYSTPSPYLFGYLYTGGILLTSVTLGRRSTIIATGIAAFLTLLNTWVPNPDAFSQVTLVNRCIAVLSLVVTAWLSLRLQGYAVAIHQQRTYIALQAQLARIREDFMATLAHDLKTPILGSIETIKALQEGHFGSLKSEQSRVLAVMAHSHQLLLHLVETLMDIFRYDLEGLHLQYSTTDLARIAEESILHLTPLASARQIFLLLKFGDSDFRQTCLIQADGLQIRRVFDNLLTNAIHHSRRGQRVEVVITAQEQRYLVSVKDQGQGISTEELPHLFERFYQGHSHGHRRGSGLGLYLSRQIVEAHGGWIWAEGHPGQGATFRFTLPLNPSEE